MKKIFVAGAGLVVKPLVGYLLDQPGFLVTVGDVDRSIKFYQAAGLKVLRISRMRRNSGEEYRNAYMYSGRFMLELLPVIGRAVRAGGRSGSIEKTLHGALGITHLGFRVRDLDAAMERLAAVGARKIGRPFQINPGTVNNAYFDEKADRVLHYVRRPAKKAWRIALFADPDGVTVELVER